MEDKQVEEIKRHFDVVVEGCVLTFIFVLL